MSGTTVGQANTSSLNITAPTITPGASDLVLGLFGTRRGQTTITPPPGTTPTYDERSDSSSAATASGTTLEIATGVSTGAATGAKVAVAGGTAAINIGQHIALNVDTTVPTAPTLTLADASADVHTTGTTAYYRPTGAGSFDVTAASTDAQSGIASYNFPALAGFTGSGAAATRTYTLATPTEPNGTKNVTGVDNATNVSTASTFTLTSDSTAPASVYTFPAAAGKYNATGWTGSITGTASDAGSGLATVEVAIQQSAGNYYDGSTFANAGITWLTATGTSAWSYAIAAAKLTSGNTYTISVRSTDNVSNVETAVTRSFVYDTAVPTQTLGLNTVTQNGGLDEAFISANTVFYRGTTAGSVQGSRHGLRHRWLRRRIHPLRSARRRLRRLDVHRLDCDHPGCRSLRLQPLLLGRGDSRPSPTAAATPNDAALNAGAATTLTLPTT